LQGRGLSAASNHRGVEKHRWKFDLHQPDGDPLHSLDLLLKHLDATLATYKRRQMKHLKHASETLDKKNHQKTLENRCKHT
jgi:hypothetical protein